MLVTGAELLVRGGGNVALQLHIPALVVGLTIVAFGTSAPELTVSVIAATQASTDVALSNVNGSNLANILFVLGLAAMIRPLVVERSLLRREIPVALALQGVVPLVCLDGLFSRLDGLLVIAIGIAYNARLLYTSWGTGGDDADLDDLEVTDDPLWKNLGFLAIGLVVLVVGADLFVDGAVEIAKWFELSDRFIGLTVIALGTSAPEAATAMSAARQNQVELAVGNSLGSNILNIAMVLGITAQVHPIDLAAGGFLTDMAAAFAACLLLVPLVMKGSINRLDGALMSIVYIAYLAFQYFMGPA